MAREPPKQLVRDLLRDGMQASNSFGLKPTIKYGWFDDDPNTPHVYVREGDENTFGGGETGYAAMDGAGGSPHREVSGTVELHAFATFGHLSNASTGAPQEYLWGSAANDGTVSGGVVAEIERVIDDNAVRPANPTTGNTPVRLIAVASSTPVEESDDVGPTFHHVVDVDYILGA